MKQPFVSDGICYGVGQWLEAGFGSQRAVVRADVSARAVRVLLPWRRQDLAPEEKDIRIFDRNGTRILNVRRIVLSREMGELIFESANPGEYFIYFQPCDGPALFQDSCYYPYEDTCDPSWLAELAQLSDLPTAQLLRFEARSEFDRRDPMELIASSEETASLLTRHPQARYLMFPEDRLYPVRMRDDLPYRWFQRGPTDYYKGQAQPGETYAFQIGVYACREALTNITLTSSCLHGPDGAQIDAAAIRCINLGGTDWEGRSFVNTFSVEQGQVRALWVLITIPEDATTADYHGELLLQPGCANAVSKPLPDFSLTLDLTIQGPIIAEHGSLDAWRHSRLAWLDSTMGLEDKVIPPYLPLREENSEIHLLNRSIRFNQMGFPESIRSNGHELLRSPVQFRVDDIAFSGSGPTAILTGASRITKEWQQSGGGLSRRVEVVVDFDGCVEYRIWLRADQNLHTAVTKLELALDAGLSGYFMGLGVRGGIAPRQVDWRWDVDRITNLLWTGSEKAGLHLNLMHSEDLWPQSMSYRPWGTPTSWDYRGGGGCTFTHGADETLISAFCGPRDWQPGDVEEYRFRLLITPFKPLDPNQWQYRYSSKTALHLPDPDDGPQNGMTIAHLHHGTAGVNPWINYPFLTLGEIRAFRQRLAGFGYQDVDLYYTLREISNHISEIWAMRSLGDEIFTGSAPTSEQDIQIYKSGGGYAWLQEHLKDGYVRAWLHLYDNGEVDAAIATQGLSRLHNFYIEGMDLAMKTTGCGGLYLDGLAYGRRVLQRVARVMAANRPDYRIKFHSGNNYDFSDWHCNVLAQYAEHLPYITDLWIGEMFDYDLPPDFWFVEMSGIPFGLTSEMLNYENGGNPWRGMLYAMDGRMHPCAPGLWKVWDDFGIQDAVLQGYWNADCPVHTDREDILASVYGKQGKALVALASWCQEAALVPLRIDWEKLAINPQGAVLTAPYIPNFQEPSHFDPSQPIPVQAGQGWLFVLGASED